MLKIRLSAGMVGTTEPQRKVVKALGLGKFGSVAFHADTPTIRGMLRKVEHLVTVTQAERGNADKSDGGAGDAGVAVGNGQSRAGKANRK